MTLVRNNSITKRARSTSFIALHHPNQYLDYYTPSRTQGQGFPRPPDEKSYQDSTHIRAHGSKIPLFWGLAEKDFSPDSAPGNAPADQLLNVISLSSMFSFREGRQGREETASILVLLLEAYLVKDDDRRFRAVEAKANPSQKGGLECGVHVGEVRQRDFVGL